MYYHIVFEPELRLDSQDFIGAVERYSLMTRVSEAYLPCLRICHAIYEHRRVVVPSGGAPIKN
jgi:hypothetical protein